MTTERPDRFDIVLFFFFQAEDGIRDADVTGVQTCALPISLTVARTRGAVCPPSYEREDHARLWSCHPRRADLSGNVPSAASRSAAASGGSGGSDRHARANPSRAGGARRRSGRDEDDAAVAQRDRSRAGCRGSGHGRRGRSDIGHEGGNRSTAPEKAATTLPAARATSPHPVRSTG